MTVIQETLRAMQCLRGSAQNKMACKAVHEIEYCVFFVLIWKWFLTTEVEEMRVEEGVFMEVLYGLNYGAIQAAAQGLLWAALVCNQRLQHGSHHVQLQRDKTFLDNSRN